MKATIISNHPKVVVRELNKIYWVIEISKNGTPMYWTGYVPLEGVTQEEKPMYSANIHEAQKMSKEEAEYYQGEYQIEGKIEEHMDVALPKTFTLIEERKRVWVEVPVSEKVPTDHNKHFTISDDKNLGEYLTTCSVTEFKTWDVKSWLKEVPLQPSLSDSEKKIFSEPTVKEIAKRFAGKPLMSDKEFELIWNDFISSYKSAPQAGFALEDMRKCYLEGISAEWDGQIAFQEYANQQFDLYIQSLQREYKVGDEVTVIEKDGKLFIDGKELKLEV